MPAAGDAPNVTGMQRGARDARHARAGGYTSWARVSSSHQWRVLASEKREAIDPMCRCGIWCGKAGTGFPRHSMRGERRGNFI